MVPQARESDGATPLFLAFANGHRGIAWRLLDHKADPNLGRASDGATALILASQEDSLYNVRRALSQTRRICLCAARLCSAAVHCREPAGCGPAGAGVPCEVRMACPWPRAGPRGCVLWPPAEPPHGGRFSQG